MKKRKEKIINIDADPVNANWLHEKRGKKEKMEKLKKFQVEMEITMRVAGDWEIEDSVKDYLVRKMEEGKEVKVRKIKVKEIKEGGKRG